MMFSKELLEKAKTAKSAEELLELAKKNGVELTEEEAATYFEQSKLKCDELDEDELDKVSAGVGMSLGPTPQICPICKGYFVVDGGCRSCGKTIDEIIEYLINNPIKTDSDTNDQSLRSIARGQ